MTNNELGIPMPRIAQAAPVVQTVSYEKIEEKINLYFSSDDLVGIDTSNLKALGRETLRGMVVNLMDRLWRSTLRSFPHGDTNEREYEVIADYLMDLINTVAEDKPCCMPMFRIENEHFTAGTLVRVFYKGSWVPGTVLMEPKLSVDYREPNAVYKLMTVEIRGDEPQTLQFDFRDIRVLQEVEYLNTKTEFDGGFLKMLKENVRGSIIESDNRFVEERCAAVEKLAEISLDPTEQLYTFHSKGERVAIIWNHVWTEGVVCQPEFEFYPMVIETMGGEPQTIVPTFYDKVIPMRLLEQLVEAGKITEDMLSIKAIND